MGDRPCVYEIQLQTQPTFNRESHYATMTSTDILMSYNIVNINYFQTAVQKFYKVDSEDWKAYENIPIRIEPNQTLYAKSIDKYGNESLSASIVGNVPNDGLPYVTLDGNGSTYYALKSAKRINVDESAQGTTYKIKYAINCNRITTTYLYASYYNSTGLISKITVASLKGPYTGNSVRGGATKTLTIPSGTTYILISDRTF